jgi:hypothetical protein
MDGGEKYAFVRAFLEREGVSHGVALSSGLSDRGLVLQSELGPALAGFARTLKLLTDKLAWAGVRMHGDRVGCMFARRRGQGFETVELADLSHSERMVVLFAGAFEALGLSRSLVLLDSPELYLHPEDHVRLLDGLRAALVDGQLVIATTSPAILRSVPSDHVLVLNVAEPFPRHA